MPTLKGRKNWHDAKTPRVISVTREDAKKAICKDHQNCVIAKAIKRQANCEWVDVGATTVLIKPWGTKRYIRYKLGKKAREQVKFFDEEGHFAPCFVELSVAPASLKVGHSHVYRSSGPSGRKISHRIRKPSR